MKEPKRRQGLNGTVLIMVLTVMAVLIVILMTTLTVVTTANQRIATKYEENQAYYSARSALDIFTAEMLADSDYYAYNGGTIVQYYYTHTDGTVKSASMKQGLALQGEIYKIKSQGVTTAKITAAMPGVAENAGALGLAENFKNGDNVFGGGTPEDAFFSIDDTEIESITYTISFPKLGNNTDNDLKYGKLADFDAADDDYSVATVKVEVLDRMYDMSGGPYTREDIINGTVAAADIPTLIKGGDRSKDRMRVKITATTSYNGAEGTAVLILDSYEAPQVSSSRAVTSLSDVKKGTSFNMVGGASSLTSDFTFHNNADIVGDVFAIGGFESNSSVSVHMADDSTRLITMSGFDFNNGEYPYIEGDGVLVYAYDKIVLDMDKQFGKPTNRVNLVTPGTVTFGGAGNDKVYGNIFCDTYEAKTGNGGKLYGDAYTNHFAPSGDWLTIAVNPGGTNTFTLKNDKLGNIFKSGEGKLTVSGSIAVPEYTNWWEQLPDGSYGPVLHPADEYVIIANSPNPKVRRVSDNVEFDVILETDVDITFDTGKAVKVDYFNGTHYGNALTSEFNKEFTLPGNTAGSAVSNTLVLPTIREMYGDYFNASVFLDEATNPGHGGEFTFAKIMQLPADPSIGRPADPAFDPANPSLGTIYLKDAVPDGSSLKTEVINRMAANIMTADDKFGSPINSAQTSPVTFENKAVDGSDNVFDSKITKVIRSSGILEPKNYLNFSFLNDFNQSGSEWIAIDARNSDIVLQIGDGSNSYNQLLGRFVIYGDNNVTILLPEAADGSGSAVTYNLGNSTSGQCWFVDSKLVNISGGTLAPVTLSLGSGGTTKAPNVDILGGNNASVGMGTGSFFTGYFYLPQSKFSLLGGVNGVNYGYTYSGKSLTNLAEGTTTKFGVIGSILCMDYQSTERNGVCYIGREVNEKPKGEPILKWQNVQYARY